MSTSVTYKGAEIAALENQSKTLLTAGKWLEADIIVEDVTGGSAPGLTVYSGQGTPAASLGQDGDLYIEIQAEQTAEATPEDFTASNFNSTSNLGQCIGKTAAAGSSTSNAYSSGQSNTGVANYTFDLPAIPSGATIKSVDLQVKAHEENASRSTCTLQVFAGSTQKGELTTVNGTSNTIYDVDCGSSWTAAELAEFTLRFSAGYYGGLIAGATLTVVYDTGGGYTVELSGNASGWTITSGDLYIKASGAWSKTASASLPDTIARG